VVDTELQRYVLNGKLPESVAIVAMGPSSANYLLNAVNKWDRQKFVDETWAVNAMGGVIGHDRLFQMDDLRIQSRRAELTPDGGIAAMMGWIKNHPVPVYTSKLYPEFPSAVEYPLEWVINHTGHTYFNNTVPYVVAFAIALRVAGGEEVIKDLHLYGCDYSYSGGEAHKRERGRACMEYWIAIALSHGIQVHIAQESSLLDMCEPDALYGYDAEHITIEWTEEGRFKVTKEDLPPEKIPSPEAMELRYCKDVRIEEQIKKATKEKGTCQESK